MTGQHSCPLSAQCLLTTNFSKSYVPCSVATAKFPFALQPSEKPIFPVPSSPRPLQCPSQWPVSTGMISLAFWPKLLSSLEIPFPCQGISRRHICLEDDPVCVRLKLTLKLIQFFLPITHPPFLPQLRFICHTNTWQVSSSVSSASLHPCILFYSFCVQDNLSN